MRNFRLLRADEIECRIAEIAKNGKKLTLLLYKTARTDAALLDETVGMYNWQNRYAMLDGKLYCDMGIKGEGGEWIWKSNVGTESNMEAEKGQASDAMKRAGFVWGIGTELYSAPKTDVWADKANIKDYGGKFKCYDHFSVQEIAYDEKEDISKLVIRNDTMGCECFRFEAGKRVSGGGENGSPRHNDSNGARGNMPANGTGEATKGLKPLPGESYTCAGCGKTLTSYIGLDGRTVSISKHVKGSREKYGKVLCLDCISSIQAAEYGAAE